tara:strand:- start:307 stop:918 length:612 start_codon:yes stop_codon:yes gene_type:complete
MHFIISSNFKKHFNTYIDFVDHYWINFFDKNKIKFTIIPNAFNYNFNLINKRDIKLIVLPGGNDLFSKSYLSKIRLKNEFKLIKFGIKNKIPILGVCRGMQVINFFYKGSQKKLKGHMRTRHDIYFEDKLFNKKKLNVNSFHNYGIPKNLLAKCLLPIGLDKSKNIEIFEHDKKNIFGIMFHPEREKNYSFLKKLIKKILNKK